MLSEQEVTDDHLSTVLGQISAHLQACGEVDDLLEKARRLCVLLPKDHDPLVWLQTCVIIGQLCNQSSAARKELSRAGVAACLVEVLSKSLRSLPSDSPSSNRGELYEKLVKFVMELLDHFARGSSLCIRKFLQHDVLYKVLLAVDCNTSALYASAVLASGIF